jgi:hypothetical protein
MGAQIQIDVNHVDGERQFDYGPRRASDPGWDTLLLVVGGTAIRETHCTSLRCRERGGKGGRN